MSAAEQPKPSLYERLVAAGIETDSHESDLYVPATRAAKDVIDAFVAEGGIVSSTTFRSEIDGRNWYDLPFQFDPFWAGKRGGTAAEAEDEAPAPRL